MIRDYNVVAFIHGHNHHAEHYRWPDPRRHQAERDSLFEGAVPADYRQYDVLSCGTVCWVIRIRGDEFVAAHYTGPGWNRQAAGYLAKSLKP